MYKAVYKIHSDCLDEKSQKIFTPFINCYQIHSVTIYANGLAQEHEIDFIFNNEETEWISEIRFSNNWSLIFDINYFYIRPENIEVLGFLVNEIYSNPDKSKEIISKHYIDGQFSLDNGLYKNAVLNFGTTLEGLLNKKLERVDLHDLIESYDGDAKKEDMHFIRELRNKVHPNRITESQDITRKEAIKARNIMESILRKIE